jgi:hypothetical protein
MIVNKIHFHDVKQLYVLSHCQCQFKWKFCFSLPKNENKNEMKGGRRRRRSDARRRKENLLVIYDENYALNKMPPTLLPLFIGLLLHSQLMNRKKGLCHVTVQ